MWFSWWFEELTEAAAARIREEVGNRDGAWEPLWRLLHGLTSIGSPALRSIARMALGRVKKELRGAAAGAPAAGLVAAARADQGHR